MTFPPRPPDDVDDHDCVAATDWAAFCALDQMDTHWNRPGWRPGRQSYHWMITFEEDELVEHVRACQNDLIQAGLVPHSLDLVAPDAVHLTIGRVAFTDEISYEEARTISADAAARSSMPDESLFSFDLRIGPLTGSRGAIRFSVSPWTPLLALHAYLTTITEKCLGARSVMNTDTFRPHIGIAYAHSTIGLDRVRPVLENLRSRIGPTVPVRRASLVQMERDGHSYIYREMSGFDLAKYHA